MMEGRLHPMLRAIGVIVAEQKKQQLVAEDGSEELNLMEGRAIDVIVSVAPDDSQAALSSNSTCSGRFIKEKERERRFIKEKEPEEEVMQGLPWLTPLKLLGQGGFAKVYLAATESTTAALPPQVAVKTVRFPSHLHPTAHSAAASLLRESACLSLLQDSPFIIQCYGSELVPGDATHLASLHLLLEHAALGSLEDRLHQKHPHGLHEEEVASHTRSILHGLAHIHANGLVHCDLKPGLCRKWIAPEVTLVMFLCVL